jgi:hypothetical protein
VTKLKHGLNPHKKLKEDEEGSENGKAQLKF